MSNTLQLFHKFLDTQKSAPNKIHLDNFNINNIDEDFVIARDNNGKVLSRYKDDIWDFSSYVSNPTQSGKFYFSANISTQHISDVKKAMLLIIIYGNGRNGSQYSVKTLAHYFSSVFKSLSRAATDFGIGFNEGLENNTFLILYIEEECTCRTNVINFSIWLSFLYNKDNSITGINYQRDRNVIQKLYKLQTLFDAKSKQTKIIPIRILEESLSQRWKQIEYLEQNIEILLIFFKNYISSSLFGSSIYRKDDIRSFASEVKKYKLEIFFKKYNINGRMNFFEFLNQIQGTCVHLIHAYTGMRRGEVLSLKNDCLQTISNTSGVCYLISTTSKLEGRNKVEKWVTSKEILRVIKLLNNFNQVIADNNNEEIDKIPLIVLIQSLLGDKPSVIKPKSTINKTTFIPLDNSKITITKEDKEQIEFMNYLSDMVDIKIGEVWNFQSHQYRRSLAIYSIQSGLVSIGALQKQLKHLFREMTLYYANGASFAKQFFDISKKHIAHDYNKLKPEVDALVFIKDVLFSDEKLYGSYGRIVENNKNANTKEFHPFLTENREKITKQFNNGSIAYKETALGGCISTSACDYTLTRSLLACGDCQSSIIKQSKLNHIITKQKEFIEFLDKDSIEYRTEIKDLEELENQKKLFLGSKE